MEQQMIFCPHCGEGYWITPMTLKIHCYQCGELVFHRGLAGFVDWEAMVARTTLGQASHTRTTHLPPLQSTIGG
jgi:uncharacterized protein (DUF983 family)